MITDELRTWSARRLAGWKMAREEHDELAAIADRIDAAHRAALEKLAAAVDEYEPSSIGCATVTVTPRLDWSGIAADLRGLAALCERTRGGVSE